MSSHARRSRRRVLPAAVLAGGLALAACGGPPSAAPGADGAAPSLVPGQQVSITFETYNLLNAGPWTDTITGLVEEFEQQHPDIDVTAQAPAGGIANLTGSVQQQIVAGNPPDVAQLGFGDRVFAAQSLRAVNFNEEFGDAAVATHLDGSDGQHPFHERTRTMGDVEGDTYGMPYVFSTPVLFYNADLFRAAGLDPERPPATWGEFKQAALAITGATESDGGYLACLGTGAADWCLQGVIRSAGGRVLGEDGRTISWGAGGSVAALATWQDLVGSGASPDMDTGDAQEAFSQGRLGMFLQTSAIQSALIAAASDTGFELRAAPMPAFEGHEAVPTNSGSALFSFSTDPAKKAAAWEFIKFMTSNTAYTKITSGIGYLPLRVGLVEDPNGLQQWAAANPLVRPNLAQLDRLEPTVAYPGDQYQQILTLLTDSATEVVYRGADPAATMRASQERAQGLVP
ncbi:ABC transporter substrate-binding protein [Pseudonocardia kunmingensis]|uniref:Carbohydrate ABC transporter substrate-binding protein (CUT1 family) n=1 Tax=Pseudonocardia kunmingensis TaxID=630975 RepID=A0A543DQH3_9PSEU|nr:ABC transporter substrate-binding protein [Pseudonocardia kunmingensis]TQM11565.1 carbohydrate ABC transporter substrate-binding protein (CUT1 family) [Pseudonocardia kunmingensis]